MTALAARRLLVTPGELADLCGRLGLLPPAGFDVERVPVRNADLLVDGAVHPSVEAGLVATASPQVGAQIASTVADLTAAFGIRGDLGGSMIRAGGSDVELGAWPAARFGAELERAVPRLADGSRPTLHLPLAEVATHPALRRAVVGTLRATVVAPPHLVGHVAWLATAAGWLALAPAEVRGGVRWATVRPVGAEDLAASLAPLVGSALS